MEKRWHTREDSGIRLDRDGRWFHDGEPVDHPKIVAAWNRGIERAPDGRWILRFGWDWCFIEVEDAPLQVTRAVVVGEPATEIRVTFSNEVEEPLDPSTLRVKGDVLYCASKAGLPARFSRAAQFALGERLEEQAGRLVLQLGGERFPVGQG